MTMTEARLCIIEMVGGLPLFDVGPRSALVDALESAGFGPEALSFEDESGLEPFVRDDALQTIPGPSQRTMLLVRRRDPAYDMVVGLGWLPKLYFESLWMPQALFELSDAIASACRPDMGWAFVPRPVDPPFATESQKIAARYDRGTGAGGTLLVERGPAGLGMRTYFGPRALAQLPGARLHALPAPAIVSDLPWGGVRVDLLDAPFSADDATLVRAYAAAMGALEPSGFFASTEVSERSVTFVAPKWWTRDAFDVPTPAPAPRPSRSQVQRLVAAARGGVPVTDATFEELDGRGAGLHGLRAERVELSRSDLADASFESATLVDVDIEEAEISRVSFARAQLDQVSLRRAEGEDTTFSQAEIVSSFFASSRLARPDFDNARISLADFGLAELIAARFGAARLVGCTFGGSRLRETRFAGATLERCDFTGADLSGVDFSGATLDRCVFAKARLTAVKWGDARLRDCTFDEGARPST